MTRLTFASLVAASVVLGLNAMPASAQYGYGVLPGGCYGGNCPTGKCPTGNCPNGNCNAKPASYGYGTSPLYTAAGAPYYSTNSYSPYATGYGNCPNGQCANGKCATCPNGQCKCPSGMCNCASGKCDCPNCVNGNCPSCNKARGSAYYDDWNHRPSSTARDWSYGRTHRASRYLDDVTTSPRNTWDRYSTDRYDTDRYGYDRYDNSRHNSHLSNSDLRSYRNYNY